jgi:hypothetical protein
MPPVLGTILLLPGKHDCGEGIEDGRGIRALRPAELDGTMTGLGLGDGPAASGTEKGSSRSGTTDRLHEALGAKAPLDMETVITGPPGPKDCALANDQGGGLAEAWDAQAVGWSLPIGICKCHAVCCVAEFQKNSKLTAWLHIRSHHPRACGGECQELVQLMWS